MLGNNSWLKLMLYFNRFSESPNLDGCSSLCSWVKCSSHRLGLCDLHTRLTMCSHWHRLFRPHWDCEREGTQPSATSWANPPPSDHPMVSAATTNFSKSIGYNARSLYLEYVSNTHPHEFLDWKGVHKGHTHWLLMSSQIYSRYAWVSDHWVFGGDCQSKCCIL